MAVSRVLVLCATIVLTIVKVNTAPIGGLLSSIFGGGNEPPKPQPFDLLPFFQRYPNQPSEVPAAPYPQLSQFNGQLSPQLGGLLSSQLGSQLGGQLSPQYGSLLPSPYGPQPSAQFPQYGPLSQFSSQLNDLSPYGAQAGAQGGSPFSQYGPLGAQAGAQLNPALAAAFAQFPGSSGSGYPQPYGDPYGQLALRYGGAENSNSAADAQQVAPGQQQVVYAEGANLRSLVNQAPAEAEQSQKALRSLLESTQAQSPVASSLISTRVLPESKSAPVKSEDSSNSERGSSLKTQ